LTNEIFDTLASLSAVAVAAYVEMPVGDVPSPESPAQAATSGPAAAAAPSAAIPRRKARRLRAQRLIPLPDVASPFRIAR
jgi:hypothetical protein